MHLTELALFGQPARDELIRQVVPLVPFAGVLAKEVGLNVLPPSLGIMLTFTPPESCSADTAPVSSTTSSTDSWLCSYLVFVAKLVAVSYSFAAKGCYGYHLEPQNLYQAIYTFPISNRLLF